MLLRGLRDLVPRIRDVGRLVVSLRLLDDLQEMKLRMTETISGISATSLSRSAEQYLVSVVVPTRNDARNLSRLLESLSKSDYRRIEIIVCDYLSNDGTVEIARSSGAKVIQLDKRGVGLATYLGTQKAAGDIVVRVDADTTIPSQVIPYVSSVFLENPRVKVAHVGHVYYDSTLLDNIMAFFYDKYWRDVFNTTGHFIAFRKDVTERVNFDPNVIYGDDFDFGARAYKEFGRGAFHYNYRVCVLTSARRIRASGRVSYILGARKR